MSTSGKLITLAIVWSVLAVMGAVVYKFFVAGPRAHAQAMAAVQQEYEELRQQALARGLTPKPDPLESDIDLDAARQKIEVLKRRLTGGAPSNANIEHQIRLALDSFSGYSILRSPQFHRDLESQGIGIELVDDQADYQRRLERLQNGEVQMAVFTIDALVKAIADTGHDPATIVLILDETIGADAMVAYTDAVPNLDALNRADAKIVVTRDSPSETLARVVIANFNVPKLGDDPWVDAQGAEDVFDKFKAASKKEPRAYVLWEPYVSKALEVPGAQRLIDSSRFTGFIVDVLVAQRDFLLEHEAEVQHVIEAYLRTSYETRQTSKGLQRLVLDDAKAQGEPLTAEQADALVDGIWWKNTQENYAHFGILGSDSGGLQSLDSMIRSITAVLEKTGALTQDPLQGQYGSLYYPGLLKTMHADHYHPSVIPGRGAEEIRGQKALRELSDQEWSRLEKVGTLPVEQIVFAPGTSTLRPHSKFALARLVDVLNQFPQYYLTVKGSARQDGDTEANMRLAKARAESAAQYIVDQGIDRHRVHAEAEPLTDESQQTVTFVLGQIPY